MTKSPVALWLRAGLLTGIVDGLFASILSVAFFDSTVARLFQGVASTLIGRGALDGGTPTALLGLVMHFGVALGWSAVFVLITMRSARVLRLLATPAGTVSVAAAYGPFIWLVMSLVVVPVLLQRPPNISNRWWIQFIGHFPFVGLPIVASIARGIRPAMSPNAGALELPAVARDA